MLNIPVFSVNTPEAFYDQLVALASYPEAGNPDPARLQAFLAKHPESAKARELIRSYPFSSGFANSTYNSLNAFRFINAKGAAVPIRWSIVPAQPFEPISTADRGRSPAVRARKPAPLVRSWSPLGSSTAVYAGVYPAELLRHPVHTDPGNGKNYPG